MQRSRRPTSGRGGRQGDEFREEDLDPRDLPKPLPLPGEKEPPEELLRAWLEAQRTGRLDGLDPAGPEPRPASGTKTSWLRRGLSAVAKLFHRDRRDDEDARRDADAGTEPAAQRVPVRRRVKSRIHAQAVRHESAEADPSSSLESAPSRDDSGPPITTTQPLTQEGVGVFVGGEGLMPPPPPPEQEQEPEQKQRQEQKDEDSGVDQAQASDADQPVTQEQPPTQAPGTDKEEIQKPDASQDQVRNSAPGDDSPAPTSAGPEEDTVSILMAGYTDADGATYWFADPQKVFPKAKWRNGRWDLGPIDRKAFEQHKRKLRQKRGEKTQQDSAPQRDAQPPPPAIRKPTEDERRPRGPVIDPSGPSQLRTATPPRRNQNEEPLEKEPTSGQQPKNNAQPRRQADQSTPQTKRDRRASKPKKLPLMGGVLKQGKRWRRQHAQSTGLDGDATAGVSNEDMFRIIIEMLEQMKDQPAKAG
jgi:hypothetical protein